MAGEIFTAREVAALLKINVRTVYSLARAGVIPGNRIGRMWRFKKSEVLGLVVRRDKQQKMNTSRIENKTGHSRVLAGLRLPV